MNEKLFTAYKLGDLELANRIVMAPLTRNRADPHTDAPLAMHAEYYSQRAGAGLIISEGTQISPEGKGYYRTPGIYNDAQVAGWRRVTDAVHAKGGKIFCQLWHVGRVSHRSLQPYGQAPVAPSAIAAKAETFVASGFVSTSTPRALASAEIPRLVNDYIHAAACARRAGFDGVELHAANGYLLDQFFREASNQRDDQYGGSVENRVRILREVLAGLATVWSPGRIGVRFSPFSHASGTKIGQPMPTYLQAMKIASEAGLAYVHMVEGETGGPRSASAADLRQLRETFNGCYMANNGYDRALAVRTVGTGEAELICFGVPYIANPDLAKRLELNAPLNSPDQSTFYGGDERGYTDYPLMDD